VGCALALALVRRGVEVVLLEAEPDVGGGASGTGAGVLRTGFDAVPGSLEAAMVRHAAALRPPLLEALGVPVLRCGALVRDPPPALLAAARTSGVEHVVLDDGTLHVPGEGVTDPVAFVLALAAAAERHGAQLRRGERFEHRGQVPADLYVNCAGRHADAVARALGDDTVGIVARTVELLVVDAPVDHIHLTAVPGVLVAPTLDGHTVCRAAAADGGAGPARREVLARARELCPQLADASLVGTYVGVEPAGRDASYVVGRSTRAPELVNVAALGATGLTAAVGLAEHVAGLIAPGAPVAALRPGPAPPVDAPWWRRATARRPG